ncbi:MAG: BCCT family transporter [Desulfococcaceae bacterium]
MTDENSSNGKNKNFSLEVQPQVFFTSTGIILLLIASTLLLGPQVENFFEVFRRSMTKYAGWFFIWTVNIILIFILLLPLGKFGNIRLGGLEAEPEFTTSGWLAMLFGAGMGIGLLFYGVAEPMLHFGNPPVMDPRSVDAAREAMAKTFLHWGVHPWALYALVAIALGFFAFNRGMPLSVRTAFYPILGDRIHGWAGHAIDILAIIPTLFGVATSLGLGVQQLNAGLNHVFGLNQSAFVQVHLIAGITAIATWSVIKGLDKGIRRLSEANMILAAALAAFVLVLGPTLFILDAIPENIGFYFQNLPRLSTWGEVYEGGAWQGEWTIFYWSWWIAWSPFVGMFIARISYGRSIRQIVLGVLLVPTLVTALWFSIFGNTAIQIEMFGGGGIFDAVQDNISVAFFVLLEKFPLNNVTSLLASLVVVSFFVTSSDSGSMVIDMIACGGNPDPPMISRIFWAVLEGAVAAILLVGGGLTALKAATISTGLPFAVILLFMCISLQKGLARYLRKHELGDNE